MNNLNYHHLYYFHVIAREGSIARACHVLYLAQPTLSAQLAQLEKSLGVKLFDRIKQRLQLTAEGRFVLDYTESIFEMGQELQDALRDKSHRGKVHVQLGVVNGTPRAFAHALLECVLRFKDIGQVHLIDESAKVLLEELKRHQIDALLTDSAVSGVSEDFESHLVANVPVVFAACRDLRRKIRRVPEDLEGAPLLLPLSPSLVHKQVMSRLVEWKVRPRIISEVQDLEIVRRLALSGHGVAPMNAYSVSVSQPTGELGVIPATRPLQLTESAYLVTRKRRWQNPAVDYALKNFRLEWERSDKRLRDRDR